LRPQKPKIETEDREQRWGSWGGGSEPSPTARGSGEAPIGIRGEELLMLERFPLFLALRRASSDNTNDTFGELETRLWVEAYVFFSSAVKPPFPFYVN